MAAKLHSTILAFAGVSMVALSPSLAQAQAQPSPQYQPQPVQTISATDKAEGAKAHPQLVQEFGGAMTGYQANYVESVGRNIAVQSGLGNARSDFTVTLLNSSVNNAFAVPGGYVYVTRELVGLMNNEAELAGVLGHEVGHVAAQHQKKRQAAAQKNTIFGVLGSVLAGAVLGNSAIGNAVQQYAMQGSQLLTLKYSRSQETEADNLGISYLRKAGYDPRAMGTVLQNLANENALEAKIQGSSTQVPTWASTHPADGPRVAAALRQAGVGARGVTNRDKFLAGINGIMWGDDPKQGVVEGRKFTHPEMRFSFDAPQGFYLVNGTRAVAISGQSGKGELSSGAYNGNMEAYINAVFAGLDQQGQAQIRPSAIQRTTVNGIPTSYGTAQATTSNGQVDVIVFAYELNPSRAVHFLTIVPSGNGDVFNSMFGSMHRISDSEAGAIRPRKIVVMMVKRGDTLQSLASRMAYGDNQMDRFLVLNGLTSTSALVLGQKIKLVTY
ncbi:MAG: M48 family metalloprotease [Novosphingobium sp.]